MSEFKQKKVFINTEKLHNSKSAIFCYISSDRSDGKSTDIVRNVYDEFKKSGKIGVVARRFAGEVSQLTIDTFCTNLKKVRDTGELTSKGSIKKMGVTIFEDGIPFLLFVCLSRATAFKSSLDVATHKDLYIDEYIPLNGKYLQNEVDIILELYRTIDRDTFSNKIYVYSNHVTLSCPIFSYFEIVPKDGLTEYKNGRFIVLQIANKGNREMVKKSPLGELTNGTPYGNFIEGGTLDNFDGQIMEHTRDRLPFVIMINKKQYAFFVCKNGDGLSLDYCEDRGKDEVYSTKPNATKGEGIYLPFALELFKHLKKRLNTGKLFCSSQMIAEEAGELFQLLGDR